MFVIVGLGNPGLEYETTRHNLGFLVADLLAQEHDIELSQSNFGAVWGKGKIEKEQIVIAKPLTFVNRSGDSVKELVKLFETCPAELLVVHDDLDLPLSDVRVKIGGGSGGHNGLRSVIDKLNDDSFIRIRIGIGRPKGRQDPADFVLKPFSDKEWEEIQAGIVEAVDAVVTVVTCGADKVVRKFSRSKE